MRESSLEQRGKRLQSCSARCQHCKTESGCSHGIRVSPFDLLIKECHHSISSRPSKAEFRPELSPSTKFLYNTYSTSQHPMFRTALLRYSNRQFFVRAPSLYCAPYSKPFNARPFSTKMPESKYLTGDKAAIDEFIDRFDVITRRSRLSFARVIADT